MGIATLFLALALCWVPTRGHDVDAESTFNCGAMFAPQVYPDGDRVLGLAEGQIANQSCNMARRDRSWWVAALGTTGLLTIALARKRPHDSRRDPALEARRAEPVGR